ncbi:hypothetical protein FZI91_16715 [Mycobacterium sp. CBMA271]|uniref:DUF6049 family protein n=1 Tax=unclassified Mycobacteroides TaxID=2618759 RepID=UPI0012DFCB48|nr:MULTISPECIES: DUF6049 family protein [unclassified Mycobacteroides]MUM17095.1 hypothetical protein [Mycobacteroides sp. CBMA 326]MUM23333.1 hypothetical protein [Mycobacteroides sp. CBMA 271]
MSRATQRNATRAAVVLAVLALILLGAPWSVPRAQAYRDGQFLKVLIDEVSPQSVTTADSMVTVKGTVVNVGDRPVTDVVVRLERADAVTTSADLRANLHGRYDQFQPIGEFITVAETLEQGQQRPFTLSFPLHGGTAPTLNIDKPGVYPALVNVNGTPDHGGAARLDDARFLLPVLGVPPSVGGAAGPEVAPDTSRPLGLTLLWPLADRPRLVPGQPGGPTPVRLLDDQLEQSLSPGGRLDALLGALEFATDVAVDPTGDLGRTVCLAIDPDLLVTVNEMTLGYQVLDNSADPAGPTRPGTGQGLAVGWLDRLRALAKHTCVTPLPYAQAGLDAVAQMHDEGLAHQATTGTADVLDQILGIASLRGATILGDDQLSKTSIDLLTAQGPTVAVSPLPSDQEAPPDFAPRRISDTVVAAPFDPSMGAALSATGRTPTTPEYVHPSLRFALQHDSRVARMQDAIGAMAWQALTPRQTPRQAILLPSASWDLSEAEARAILSTTSTLLHSGLAIARPLPTVIGEARAGAQPNPIDTTFGVDSPGTVDDWVSQELGDEVRRLWGLTAALSVDARTGLTGTQYTDPLRQDALRAVSQSVPPDARDDTARERLVAIRRTVGDLFNAVTVVNPGGSYTLATEHSPLPLVLRNELPVPIRVALRVDTPAGMSATDVGVQEVPPGYLPVKVPVEVNVSQRMAVDVTLHTPDGLPLGDPVRLSVHSNAYGKLLFFITISAATVLFALTGRRLWHRFRGQPDRADLDRADEAQWQP